MQAVLQQGYTDHQAELMGFLMKRVARDIAQDILHDLYLRLSNYQPDKPIYNVRALLYRIANNLLTDYLRAQQRKSRKHSALAVVEHDNHERSPEQVLEQRERIELLLCFILELSPKCQQVFQLCRIEGVEQAEIAERMGISRNMVEKHLRKALRHCQQRIREKYNE